MGQRFIQVRVDPWLHSAVKAKCATFGLSIKDVLRRFAEAFVTDCKDPGELDQLFKRRRADGRARRRGKG